MSAEERKEALVKLESAHAKVMEDLGGVWVAMEAVRSSEPTDNLHDLLEELENAVSDARDGGFFGSGANAHRRALKDWHEIAGDAV